ncbi:B3 domain-containing protein [Drosera capensis]
MGVNLEMGKCGGSKEVMGMIMEENHQWSSSFDNVNRFERATKHIVEDQRADRMKAVYASTGESNQNMKLLMLGHRTGGAEHGNPNCHDEEGGSDVSPVGSADLSSKSEAEMVQNGNGESDWRDKLNEGENAPSGMRAMTEAQGAIPLSCYPRSETIPWNTSFSRNSCPASFTSNGRTGCSIRENHGQNSMARPREMNDGSAGGTSSSEGKLSAVSFTSSFPNFMEVMKYSDTKGPYILHIPCNFSSAYFPNCKIEVVLRNLKGQSWIVNSMPVSNKTTRHMFCGGWSAFVRENGVKSGDSCVFELIGTNSPDSVFIILKVGKRYCIGGFGACGCPSGYSVDLVSR